MEIALLVALATLAPAFGAPPPKAGFHAIAAPTGMTGDTEVCGISADGSVVLGYVAVGADRRALKWTDAGTQSLGEISWTTFRIGGGQPAFDAAGHEVSLVGIPNESLRWAKSVEVLDAPPVPLGKFRTLWVWLESADGAVFAGTGSGKEGTEAFRWTKGSDPEGLGDLKGGGFYSQANGISADGAAIVGMSRSFDGPQAFLWTKAGGIVGLGMLGATCKSTEAQCVSKDAKTVGGMALTDAGVEAFVWTKAKGIQTARAFMAAEGIAFPTGWKLEEALCVSDDGNVLAGNGVNPSGKRQGWVLVVGKAGSKTSSAKRTGL